MSEIHCFSLNSGDEIIFYKSMSDMRDAIEDWKIDPRDCHVIIGHCDEDYWMSEESHLCSDEHNGDYILDPVTPENRKGDLYTYTEYLDHLERENEKLKAEIERRDQLEQDPTESEKQLLATQFNGFMGEMKELNKEIAQLKEENEKLKEEQYDNTTDPETGDLAVDVLEELREEYKQLERENQKLKADGDTAHILFQKLLVNDD